MPAKAVRSQEPQIFLIKSLPRYDFGRMRLSYREFTHRQDKYNTLLQQIGRCFGFGVIEIYSISPRDRLCYDEDGNGRQLAHRGMYRFWRELLQVVSDMDREKDKLHRKRILQEEMHRNHQPAYTFASGDH